MGKYMKKGKITGDVAVMEVPQTTSLGVRTRAKTLALQPNPDLSYLQLRSRRLEKPPFHPKQEKPRNGGKKKSFSGSDSGSGRVRVGSERGEEGEEREEEEVGEGCFGNYCGVEGSFGENNLELDARERSTRESTPCSLIRELDSIGTPSSTTRPTCSGTANRRSRNVMQRAIPTTPEMEEFFAEYELEQQRLFIDKYNFDIVNDSPLPGRYEWVRVNP